MRILISALVLLIVGCTPGAVVSAEAPTADAPFTLTALDVGHPTFRFRCMSDTPCGV